MNTIKEKAITFFYHNAPYSYNPNTETQEEGRRSCAAALAKAEFHAELMDFTFEWNSDDDADWSWMDEEDRMNEHEVYYCAALNREGKVMASLCGIFDPDNNYRRVVEAELALEAIKQEFNK